MNTGETNRATEEGLATDAAGFEAGMLDVTLAEEAATVAALLEEDEDTGTVLVENPPPDPPPLADTEALTDADAADSGLPVFL